MKRVAIISDMYYPDMSSPSAVLDKYVQSMKGNEYEFHILTITYEKNFPLLDDDFIKVYYIENYISRIRALCVHLRRTKRYTYLANIGLFLLRIYTFVLSQFKYPLANSWEINEYFKLFNKISLNVKFDSIISVSNTVFSQYAAKLIKESHPEIKWINFITDPFTDHYIYYPFLKRRSKLRKKHIYDETVFYNLADFNMLTAELYNRAIYEFRQTTKKTFQISYVLSDLRKLISPPLTINNQGSVVKVIYAGAIYRKIRNPEIALSIFSKIDNVIFDLYVKGNECNDILAKYNSNKIRINPCANRFDYLRMICYEYDILINIGNVSTLQTPSKPLELISTGKPIINFYKVKDSQYELFEKYPLGLNIRGDENDVVTLVYNFCIENKGKQLSYSLVEDLFPDNLLECQVKLLSTLLNS